MKTRAQKIQIVGEIEEKLKGYKHIVLTNFTGLTMDKLQALRKELKKQGIFYKVLKKNLVSLALEKFGVKLKEGEGPLNDAYKGSVGIAVSYGEEFTGPKIIHTFGKKNTAMAIIGGVIENRVATKEEMIQLATLPSREELLARLAFVLKFPLTKLAMTISEVGKKKGV